MVARFIYSGHRIQNQWAVLCVQLLLLLLQERFGNWIEDYYETCIHIHTCMHVNLNVLGHYVWVFLSTKLSDIQLNLYSTKKKGERVDYTNNNSIRFNSILVHEPHDDGHAMSCPTLSQVLHSFIEQSSVLTSSQAPRFLILCSNSGWVIF